MEHSVHLPHPSRDGVTVGRCECGWLVTYSWGEHGDAVSAAGAHIEQSSKAEAVEVGTLAGDRTVIPGRSL